MSLTAYSFLTSPVFPDTLWTLLWARRDFPHLPWLGGLACLTPGCPSLSLISPAIVPQGLRWEKLHLDFPGARPQSGMCRPFRACVFIFVPTWTLCDMSPCVCMYMDLCAGEYTRVLMCGPRCQLPCESQGVGVCFSVCH